MNLNEVTTLHLS